MNHHYEIPLKSQLLVQLVIFDRPWSTAKIAFGKSNSFSCLEKWCVGGFHVEFRGFKCD